MMLKKKRSNFSMSQDQDDKQISLELPEKQVPIVEAGENKPTDENIILDWICHPAKRNKKVTVAVSILIAVLVAVVYYATFSVWFTILGFLILTGSLAGFYFPSHYQFTDNKIIIITKMQKLEKNWSQYRSYYSDKNGVLLSPFARPSRLENFRGIYIKFWYNKDEVMAIVKDKIKRDREN